MAEYADAKYGVALNFGIGLIQQADTKLLKAGPTLAAGDFKISKDFGALSNLATLPDAEPDAGRQVRVQLSATEMEAGHVGIECVDAAGAEWCDQYISIWTRTKQLTDITAKTDSLTFTVAGLIDSNVLRWNGTAVATPDTAGHPKVTIKVGTGTGELSISGGKVPTRYGIVKNNAFSNFEFLMTLASDHATPATGKTITAERSIDGGAFGACANSASEVSAGMYKINLAAADLNGDCITLKFTATACDATYVTIITQSAA